MTRADDPTAEATDLLRDLIRNQCVNDGRIESGQETKNVDLLGNFLEGAGLDMERYEPQPGRSSLVARIEGSDPQAPSLLLMGHTDVVPVNPDGWSRDPFGAEIVDGFIWGRGAVDMLNETATMALAFRRLADSGFKPRGTLTYLAVADEEALGRWGAKWLVENERDAVYADYVLTESGGFQLPTPEGPRLPVMADEKGTYWSKFTVHGTPGHASQPFRTENAVVVAAEVVRRLSEYEPPDGVRSLACTSVVLRPCTDPKMSEPACLLNCWIKLLTEGASNTARTEIAASKVVLIAAIKRIAESESPPRAKKSSSRPTRSTPSTSANAPATSFSVGVCGAWKGAAANTGAGRAFRSSLPEEVRGNSSSATMCAGTMYSGSHALNR